jgi:hypothetical protein
MPADEDGQRLARHRADLDGREVEHLAVVLEVPAGRQPADDLQFLVHALAAARPGHPGTASKK